MDEDRGKRSKSDGKNQHGQGATNKLGLLEGSRAVEEMGHACTKPALLLSPRHGFLISQKPDRCWRESCTHHTGFLLEILQVTCCTM